MTAMPYVSQKPTPLGTIKEGQVLLKVWAAGRIRGFTIQKVYKDESGTKKITRTFFPWDLQDLLRAIQRYQMENYEREDAQELRSEP